MTKEIVETNDWRCNLNEGSRRNGEVHFIKFFENPDSLSVVPGYQYRMSTKTTLVNKAKRIYDRIFVDKVITPGNDNAFSQSSKLQVVD